MKKEECCSVFMATLMIAIPIGAVIILIVYAFGFVAIPDGINTYTFIKDHGSLIAGILGVLGTIALVVIQIKLNREAIISARNLVYEERFEIDKDTALDEIYSLEKSLVISFNETDWGEVDRSDYTSFIGAYSKAMKEVLSKTSNIERFIRKYKRHDNQEMISCLNFLLSYSSVSSLAITVTDSGANSLFQSQKHHAIEAIDSNLSSLKDVFSDDDAKSILDGFSSIGSDDPRKVMDAWEIVQRKTISLLKNRIYGMKH